jgi:SAM-dependent methyltransferase
MDETTLASYDRDAAAFAQDWHAQHAPSDLYSVVRRFFKPGLTADIGCGAGRDVAWLNGNGFPAIGYDASEGLLAEARRLYSDLHFHRASLPALEGIESGRFTNVLCETVIMHLDPVLIPEAVRRLMSILKPDGILYLSWRVTKDADRRDEKGRLYAAFDPRIVLRELGTASVLLDEQVESQSSGKQIYRIVVRNAGGL